MPEAHTGADGAKHSRELELRRIQSNRVRQIFVSHQIENQGHIGRAGEVHTTAGDK